MIREFIIANLSVVCSSTVYSSANKGFLVYCLTQLFLHYIGKDRIKNLLLCGLSYMGRLISLI
jgi:hypothetical protein